MFNFTPHIEVAFRPCVSGDLHKKKIKKYTGYLHCLFLFKLPTDSIPLPFSLNLQGLSKKIPSAQLKSFIYMLIEGLLDIQSHCSSGSCVVLNAMLKNRGTELIVDVGLSHLLFVK